MPHILVAGRIHDAGMKLLAEAKGVTHDLVAEVSNDSYLPFLPKADALVIRTQKLTAAGINSAPHLKIVSRHGVGYDAVDVAASSATSIPAPSPSIR
jgi:D-3-phosphoglycerate dehydrogenase / 2-oxoglutarate reductase